jgi:LysR family transcriptional regulator, transcriptional activator of nhaA
MGEIEDSALLQAIASGTGAAFVAPTLVGDDLCRQYRVRIVGQLSGVVERVYAISVEKRLKHPAVVAIAHAPHPR